MERPAIRRLREEIQQNKPFQNPAHAAAIGLLRTADTLRRSIDTLIAPHGVSAEQYNVLRILRGAGEKGLPTLEIAARMLEKNPGITRLVDKLEVKKLVLRKRCEADRRQVFCTITKAGADLVGTLDEPARHQNQQLFHGLSEAQINTLIGLLDRIRYPDSKDKEK